MRVPGHSKLVYQVRAFGQGAQQAMREVYAQVEPDTRFGRPAPDARYLGPMINYAGAFTTERARSNALGQGVSQPTRCHFPVQHPPHKCEAVLARNLARQDRQIRFNV